MAMFFLPTLVLAASLSPARMQHHARELRIQGFTVIPDAGLDPATVDKAHATMTSEFARHLASIEQLGLDPQEDKYAFQEIATRHRKRWCLRPTRPSAWTSLLDDAVRAVTPIIESCSSSFPHADDGSPLTSLTRYTPLFTRPRVEEIGAILSADGARAQTFHADAGPAHIQLARHLPAHRLYNVFAPLVDIEADADGTQFWPGSHLDRTRASAYYDAIDRSGSLADDPIVSAQLVSPAIPKGGLLLWDFRCMHRGLPNAQRRDRPVAHAVLSTGLAWDVLELPDEGLDDALAKLPSDPAEREALSRARKEEWARVRASSKR